MHGLRKYLGWDGKRRYKAKEAPAPSCRESIEERFLKLMDLMIWLSATGIFCAMLIFLTVSGESG
jgi:hypothetical protein